MPQASESRFFLPQASGIAGPIDLLALVISLVAILFSALIVILIVWFVVKYRRGHRVDRSHPPATNVRMEVGWVVGLVAISLGLFAWASHLYLSYRRVPPAAMEILVVGKQWMWKMQHPQGRWENNELHLPLGRPIVLTMTSEDVIHSFYVPAFRVKQDVIPGTYTRLWFTPTRAGDYPLFCAEYCGTLHSRMTGKVTVMDPGDYEEWLRTGPEMRTLAELGERLFRRHGCSGCHSLNSSVRAPLLEGIYGKPVPVQIPQPGVPLQRTPATTVIADDAYLRDSILLPQKMIRAGYQPIMPTFRTRLTEEEVFALVAYLRSLRPDAEARRESQKRTRLSPEEYRARAGFVPREFSRPEGRRRTPGSARAREESPPTGTR